MFEAGDGGIVKLCQVMVQAFDSHIDCVPAAMVDNAETSFTNDFVKVQVLLIDRPSGCQCLNLLFRFSQELFLKYHVLLTTAAALPRKSAEPDAKAHYKDCDDGVDQWENRNLAVVKSRIP